MHIIISACRPGRRLIQAHALFAVFALLLSGCAFQRPVGNQPRYPSPEAAVRAVSANSPPADLAVTATARVEISRQGERYPMKMALMMKRPSLLRVESIPLIGPPDFFLSVAEGELRVHIPAKNLFYTGRAAPENISRFFPIFMPVSDLLYLLMGMAPESGEGFRTLRGEQEEIYFRVDEYSADRRIRSLWIDPSDNRLVKLRMFSEGGAVDYEADFAEPAMVGGFQMPQRLTISGNGIASLVIRYRDIQNITFDRDSFVLRPPDGIKPVSLDP